MCIHLDLFNLFLSKVPFGFRNFNLFEYFTSKKTSQNRGLFSIDIKKTKRAAGTYRG